MKIDGEKVRAYLRQQKQKGIDNKVLAERMGMKEQNFSNRINSNPPSFKFVSKLCEAENLNITDFLTDENTTVAEPAAEYGFRIVGNETRKNLELQFDTILQGQEAIEKMLVSGVEFSKVQSRHLHNLRELIGV